MNWKALGLSLAHFLAGAAASAGLATAAAYAHMPGVNPLIAAAIGGALGSGGTSVMSAFAPPPTEK